MHPQSVSPPGWLCRPSPAPPQALHCEQNRFSALPLGPYLCSLRELLLGWHTALGSTAALRAATRLSRLVLWRTSLQEAPADPEIDLPAEAGESFVEALAAMPALRRVDDDMKRPGKAQGQRAARNVADGRAGGSALYGNCWCVWLGRITWQRPWSGETEVPSHPL